MGWIAMIVPTPKPTADRMRRFEKKFTPEPNTGCFIWHGGVNEHGYGIFWNGVRLEKAHRFALKCSGVEVPDDRDVCHHCDIPPCVNPEHMFIGEAQSNVNDMWRKRRATVRIQHGTAQVQAKLTDEIVAEIRSFYVKGETKQRDIAADYGVSQTVIWKVVNHKNWKRPSGVVIERGRGK